MQFSEDLGQGDFAKPVNLLIACRIVLLMLLISLYLCPLSEYLDAVSFLWFLLGLSIGGLATRGYYVQLHRKLGRMANALGITRLPVNLVKGDQFTAALTDYCTSYQHLAGQVSDWDKIFKNAPIGYLQVDSENQLLWCNEIACQYLAIQRYQGAAPRLLLEVVRSYELDALIEQARDQQAFCQRDWAFYPALESLPSPEQHPSRLMRGSALPLLEGQVGVFLENRQEVAQLAQQRDRWVSDVAHELKTPLTSIRLVAESLQTRLEPPHRQWIDRLLNEAIRLSTLVQEFLDLSHLEVLPARQLTCKAVDLIQLIKSAWGALEPLATTKTLTLKLRGVESVILQADEARLYRVFINLFDNCIKYSPPHADIDLCVSFLSAVTAEPLTTQVQIDLIDRGPGIPEPDLPFIFERLYRSDPSRARQATEVKAATEGANRAVKSVAVSQGLPYEVKLANSFDTMLAVQPGTGSGLGLAIVRQIVEAHGGSVTARNDPKTGGAWVQLRFPLAT